MKITIKIPITGYRVASIRVPDDAQNDITNFLLENPEYLEDIEQNGHLEGENWSLLDAQVEID